MAAFTPNYGLHQWEPEDQFLRTDFNEDFSKIDIAIRAAKAQAETLNNQKAEMTAGYYMGDGKDTQDIVLGFRPCAVLLLRGLNPAMAVTGAGSYGLELTANGFTAVHVTTGAFDGNDDNTTYRYLALK